MNYMTVKRAGRNLDLWNGFDRTFDSFFNSLSEVNEVRTPYTEIQETEAGLVMSLELPGFSSDELEVKVEDNLLSIKAAHLEEEKEEKKDKVRAESQNIRFEKSYVLSKDIDASKIEADFRNGLLKLKLPHIEKPAPLKIQING